MHRILKISPETEELLIAIGDRMGLSQEGLQTEEIMELVIDTMANSVDAQFEYATTGEGAPLSMDDALNAIMNPDISTEFVQPTTVMETPYQLTWEDIVALDPHHDADKHTDIERRAIVIVFNQLPKDQWASEHAEKLIDNTVLLLQKNAQK